VSPSARSAPDRLGSLRRYTPISEEFGYERGVPIDRYYIEKFLAAHASDVRGRTLEIGDDAYTRRFGGDRVRQRDVLHIAPGAPGATIIADLAQGDAIPSHAFDCIILTQTLHLLYDVRAALRTVDRVLAPGGVLLATVPGITAISSDEWSATWYWSFTELGIRELFAACFQGVVATETHGNALAACAFLHGLAAEELGPDALDVPDPGYEVTIAIRARRDPNP
jgi:SAM-dependent methyltransferase